MATSVINENTYRFIQVVAAKFDASAFPDTEKRTLILDPRTDGIKLSSGEVYSGTFLRKRVSQILPELGGEIAKNAENFSEWVAILNGIKNYTFANAKDGRFASDPAQATIEN